MLATGAALLTCAAVTSACVVIFCLIDTCFPVALGYRVVPVEHSVPV